MKCNKCGKNEVSFRFSSNHNGSHSEMRLCADCAAESGLSFRSMFNMQSPAEGFFGTSLDSALYAIPVFGFSMMPANAFQLPRNQQANESEADPLQMPDSMNIPVDIDETMRKRREINILKEQMNLAAKAEDYEKAAQLRDQIELLENKESRQQSEGSLDENESCLEEKGKSMREENESSRAENESDR